MRGFWRKIREKYKLGPIVLVIVATALILLVPYLWGEHLTLSRDYVINYDKFSSYFTAFGAIATAVGLVFVYAQLQESKDAKIANNKPYIRPKNVIFTTTDPKLIEGSKFNVLFTRPYTMIDPVSKESGTYESTVIRAENVGPGVALDVHFEWISSYPEVVDIIKRIYNWPHFPYTNNDTKYEILKSGSDAKVDMPSTYLLLCTPTAIDKEIDINNLRPFLKFRISYKDIYRTPLSNIFSVKVIATKLSVKFDFTPEE